MPDPNVPQGQAQPQAQQAPQGQLPPDKAEAVARQLIQSHPQMFAHLAQPGQGQAPAGAQAAPADLLKYLPQAIAFVQAFYSALQAAGFGV